MTNVKLNALQQVYTAKQQGYRWKGKEDACSPAHILTFVT